jgi:hypothetical protein
MYGENGTRMRSELAVLLRQHRVQQRLGGPGSKILATTTAAEREEYGILIRRYRQGILAWCAGSVETARPTAFSNLRSGTKNPFRLPGPDASPPYQLALALEVAISGSTARLPTLEELNSAHGNPVVDRWREAARAAALAEHDTNGGAITGRLTLSQAQALVADVAAITQALVVLDQRYTGTPGWEPLDGSARLGWTALACALDAGLRHPDYSVDQTGWRPRVKPMRGQPKPGVLGVLQAEHNLLVHLKSIPTATNLRSIVDSQRLLSDWLAVHASMISSEVGDRWARRARTYTLIQQQLRNIGGNIGMGGASAAEATNATTRLGQVGEDTVIKPEEITAFETLFNRIDARIADVIEEGVRRRAYLQRVALPKARKSPYGAQEVARIRFRPVKHPSELDLIQTVRERLQPSVNPPTRVTRPDPSRVDLHTAIVHRPPPRSASTEAPRL